MGITLVHIEIFSILSRGDEWAKMTGRTDTMQGELRDARTMALADLHIHGPDPGLLADLELADGTTLGDHRETALLNLCDWLSVHPEVTPQYEELCGRPMSVDEAEVIQQEYGGIIYRDLSFNPENESEFCSNGWRWTTEYRTLIADRDDLEPIPVASWVSARWDERNLMALGGDA